MFGQNILPTIACGVAKGVKIHQSYQNYMVVENDGLPWPVFYNKLIEQKLANIVYCGQDEVLDYRYFEKISTIFNKFTSVIGAIYTDSNINWYNSYSPNTLINPPLVINGVINGKLFDERLTNLHYFAALRRLSEKSLIYHIPERLIKQRKNNNNADGDLRILGLI